MASLMDFYRPASSAPNGLAESGTVTNAGYAAEDAGLRQSLAKRQFESRTLPDLVNRQASRGAYHSSATGNALDRAREDYTVDQADTSRMLQRTMADLSRRRILAAIGVQV